MTDLRNNYLKNKQLSGEYEFVILPGDPEFARSNNPALMYRRPDESGIDGDSYNINYPASHPANEEYVDSVAWYNAQIFSWKNILKRNEEEKINAQLIENYSYDAGAVFENSTTVENNVSRSETFEFSVSPSVFFNKRSPN